MSPRPGNLIRGNTLVRVVVAIGAAAALLFIGLVMPGQAAGPYPFSQVSEIRFVQKDLCDMGTLGTTITSGQTATHPSPFFIDITDVGRCISTKSLNAPPPGNPGDADTQVDSELFDYAVVGTTTGYGTKLMANITSTQAVPFDMMVDATTGAAASGEAYAGSERFTYDSKTATSFHITARAQKDTQAATHNGGNANANQERVYASPASGKTSSVATTLTTPISAGQGMPFNIDVGSTAGAASSCGTPECILLIDNERFTYTVVDGNTFQLTARTVAFTIAAAHAASAAVLSPREVPFELEVGDARVETGFDADSPTNPATGTSHFVCFGNETLEYNPSAAQTVGDGLSGGADVIYVTGRGLDRIVGPANECGLLYGRAKEAQEDVGSAIRDSTRVQLIGRTKPEYDDGPATTAALHSIGASLVSPLDFSRCIGRSDQTVQGGPNPVVSRTRCYSRLINPPSPPGSENGAGPYFVSTNALLDSFTFISQSDGTFNDETDGVVNTLLNVFALGQCIAFGGLHVQVNTTISVDKTAGDTDYGQFRINVWLHDPACTGSPNYVIGATESIDGQAVGTNFATTPLAADSDIDKDGCSDYRETGGNNLVLPVTGQDQGGQRDAFNPYDYADINHDGAISIPIDIIGISGAFGPSSGPRYVDYKDRGVKYGPFTWNARANDGAISVPVDITQAAAQFGHACPHTSHVATVFGPHPRTLSVAVTAVAAAPFAITVNTTAGYPATGQLLIDAETVTYDQVSCGAINTATQFCVTARGSGVPAGNDPAAHAIGAIVYPKP